MAIHGVLPNDLGLGYVHWSAKDVEFAEEWSAATSRRRGMAEPVGLGWEPDLHGGLR